jgi:hypothetical protein
MNPYSINPPESEVTFEKLCLELLKRHWSRPGLERFAKRGEDQYGVDIFDTFGETPQYAAQCKLKENWKSLVIVCTQQAGSGHFVGCRTLFRKSFVVYINRASKDAIAGSCPFVFCEKLLGYFCAKHLLRFCWRFRPGWLQSGLPGAVCASGFAHGTGAGRGRNLEAVWGRFGQESRSFGQQRQFHARYANRAKPHKRWRLRILLIWRVGT